MDGWRRIGGRGKGRVGNGNGNGNENKNRERGKKRVEAREMFIRAFCTF